MLLTIGMIVKNESLNLTKCLDSLKPIRDALDSELVIVDTGSADDTVEIASRYTSDIRHFEWIKDFAAARNASLEGARGEWFMFIDADEYFGDCSDLIDFFKSGEYKKYNSATYIQRNYFSVDDSTRFSDLNAARMTKILPETRFEQPIHELLNTFNIPFKTLDTIAHHYGYAHSETNDMDLKARRNIELLLKELEKNKEKPMTYLQLADSHMGIDFDAFEGYCRKGLEAAEKINDSSKYTAFCKLAGAYYSMSMNEKLSSVTDEYFSMREKERDVAFLLATDIEFYAYKGYALLRLDRQPECSEAFKTFLRLYREYKKGMHRTNDILFHPLRFLNDVSAAQITFKLAGVLMKLEKYNAALEYLKNISQSAGYDALCSKLNLAWEIINKTKNYGALAPVIKALPAGDARPADYLGELIKETVFKASDKDRTETAGGVIAALKGVHAAEKIRALLILIKKRIDGSLSAADAEKALNAFQSVPAYCADMIYFVLCSRLQFRVISSKINDGLIALYYKNAGLKEYFPEALLAYSESGVKPDAYSALWLSQLCLLCFEGIRDGKTAVALFKYYAGLSKLYLESVYKPEILAEESITSITAAQRAGWYSYKALEAFDRGDRKTYLKYIKEAAACGEPLKPAVKAMAETLREEAPGAMSEFDMLALKIKDNIRGFISEGNVQEALKTLEAYKLLNPNDPEIAGIYAETNQLNP